MNDTPQFKPKKSVALSGVTAGNTALCSVGRTGNDLHYRGYDILEIATVCEFEEIAHLLIHERFPNRAELAAYKAKLKSLRGLPGAVKSALELLPPSTHPMDVLRTATSVLGCVLPEKDDHAPAGAREIADRLIASLGSMLVYWYHFSHSGQRIQVGGVDRTAVTTELAEASVIEDDEQHVRCTIPRPRGRRPCRLGHVKGPADHAGKGLARFVFLEWFSR